ncbi:alpha/beta hydrolase [bacterium]|nr:alpha/beta hydrolase [bacterium]
MSEERPACVDTSLIEQKKLLADGAFYQAVGDIQMFCEVRGEGPLIIHQTGAWLGSFVDSWIPALVDALSKHFTVLTFDARGQGKTTLGSGPISYGRFAADTIGLMDALDIPCAHFIGHSDGGCVQLDLLLNFSERIKTATLLGTAYNHSAYSQSLQLTFDVWLDEVKSGSTHFSDMTGVPHTLESLQTINQLYLSCAPEPDKWEEVMRQNRRCWATEPDISLRQLAAIERPVLVINAGKDPYIPTESMQQLASAIPNAECLHLPEMTHDVTPFVNDIALAVSNFVGD